jgi:hypothetical protein
MWHVAPLSPTHKMSILNFSSPSSKLMKFVSNSSLQTSAMSDYPEAKLSSSLSSFLPLFDPFLFLGQLIALCPLLLQIYHEKGIGVLNLLSFPFPF